MYNKRKSEDNMKYWAIVSSKFKSGADDDNSMWIIPLQDSPYSAPNNDIGILLNFSTRGFSNNSQVSITLISDTASCPIKISGTYNGTTLMGVQGSIVIKEKTYELQNFAVGFASGMVSVSGSFKNIGWDWLSNVSSFSVTINKDKAVLWSQYKTVAQSLPGQQYYWEALEFQGGFLTKLKIPTVPGISSTKGRFIIRSKLKGHSYVFEIRDGHLKANLWCSVEMAQIPVEVNGNFLVNSNPKNSVKGPIPVVDFIAIEDYE